MNYYQARRVDPEIPDRPDAGKWRFTNMNDKQIWSVGYCAQNCPGHETPEEADAHWIQYVADNANLDGQWDGSQHRCVYMECGTWTDRHASAGPGKMQTFDLCDEHRTRDVVRDCLLRAYSGSLIQMISSY